MRRIREAEERLLQGSRLSAQFVKDVLMGNGQLADFGCGRTAYLDTAVIGERRGDPCRRQDPAELLRFSGSDPDNGLGSIALRRKVCFPTCARRLVFRPT